MYLLSRSAKFVKACEAKSLYEKVCIYSKKFRIGVTIKKENRTSSSVLIFRSNDNTIKRRCVPTLENLAR